MHYSYNDFSRFLQGTIVQSYSGVILWANHLVLWYVILAFFFFFFFCSKRTGKVLFDFPQSNWNAFKVALLGISTSLICLLSRTLYFWKFLCQNVLCIVNLWFLLEGRTLIAQYQKVFRGLKLCVKLQRRTTSLWEGKGLYM